MEQTIYEGKTQEEKLQLLKANCIGSELMEVKNFFSEDDLEEMKSRLSETCIQKQEKEDELKELSKDLRDRIKKDSSIIKELLFFLKNKYELRTEEVYHFDDQEEGLMLTYNAQGELITSRRLRPQEKQTRIFNMGNKTA